ncbi:ATP-binding protein [Lactiplantibacillus plantarum]|uniref:ATP-binding protein n=1 Tax=Lactiplantibacillus plantarum TaxID=1590 RepID=UPI001E5FCBF8|nr:ATP-binding protein [Lactiplantibacillus plantarum]MCC6120657.1 ATP-binding protein [Lactiplantibacillus plantarum]MCW6137140.1 ATP-binding protein [Lactiplantibacillus plantarum]
MINLGSRTIGKLVSIRNGQIIAEISSDLGEYVNTLDGINFVGEVGSYVTIHDFDRDVVAEIIGINEELKNGYQEYEKPNSVKQVTLGLLGEIRDDIFTFGVTRLPRLFMEINLISTQELDTILSVNNAEPPIEANSNETYINALSIGKSTIFDNYQVKINLNNFFGYHFAVFGNTGAGKSNTIANIIQKIFSKTNRSASGAHIIMLDSNGEYDKAFNKIPVINPEIGYRNIKVGNSANSPEVFQIPVWALSVDDWAILLNASEKTQIPVIRRAIQIVKAFNSDNNEIINKLKNHIIASTIIGIAADSDSSPSSSDKMKSLITRYCTDELNPKTIIALKKPATIAQNDTRDNLTLIQAVSTYYGQLVVVDELVQFCQKYICKDNLFTSINQIHDVVFDFSDFIEAMKFAILYEGSVSSQRVQEYTAPMMSRLQSLNESAMGAIFGKTKFSTTEDFVDHLVKENQLVNIDVSSIDDSTGEVLIRVLSKMILDFQKMRKQQTQPELIYPINLIIEEAHRYVAENKLQTELGFDIFERVAKEGRKFRFLLGISSQRPSELSRTVVSQCSNFIVHRVQNPDDLNYISKMVPYINKGIIERLTYLKTGSALVFGTAINIPTLTEFAPANPKTDSDSAEISKSWFHLKNKND